MSDIKISPLLEFESVLCEVSENNVKLHSLRERIFQSCKPELYPCLDVFFNADQIEKYDVEGRHVNYTFIKKGKSFTYQLNLNSFSHILENLEFGPGKILFSFSGIEKIIFDKYMSEFYELTKIKRLFNSYQKEELNE